MEPHNPNSTAVTLTKEVIVKLILCAGLALYWVLFIWNFWDKGIYALGFNLFVFLLLFFLFFLKILIKNKYYTTSDLVWIIPLLMIIVSYAIYDNPFLKVVSLLVLPVLFAVFYNQAWLSDKQKKYWNFEFINKIVSRFFSFFLKIVPSASLYLSFITPSGKSKKRVVFRVIMGLVLFLVIALTVFIPLLSSADPIFADKMGWVYNWFKDIIDVILTYKIIVFLVFSIIFYSVISAWTRHFEYQEKEIIKKYIDPIVTGIVLAGILCLYLLFLWLQINRLWIGSLPFEFKETEYLVKSGFWQLLFLSVINIVIYFFTYRKTISLIQKILGAFTVASLLLLISAGYRMGLYVTYYGFSYEKFFAAYTVIYCAILFVWLISRLFSKYKSNIVKFLVVLFIWMYGLITIFPVEQFIMRTNVTLAKHEGSQIRLFEMTMLSPDVLGLVKNYQSNGSLNETVGYLDRENENKSQEQFDWNPWIERNDYLVKDKKWYEKNILNLITK